MTARDEAIAYMVDQEPADLMETDWVDCGRLLDAIPRNVLARLAIERGGFEQVGWQYLPYYSGEAGHADHVGIYRLVEP